MNKGVTKKDKPSTTSATTTSASTPTTTSVCPSSTHSLLSPPQTASQPPALSSFLAFVKGKHAHLSVLSSFISSSSYLLPSRFSDSDTTVEVTCALADVVSLFNDAVYHFHVPHPLVGSGMAVGSGSPSPRDVLVLRACIACLECTELALEKLAATRGMVLAGEILHVLRPLVTSAISDKYKTGSIVPWAAGLAMDAASHGLSGAGLRGMQPKSTGGKFAPDDPNVKELKRRRMRWMLYLLRAPIWQKFTGKFLERAGRLPIPGGKRVLEYLLQWVLYIQKHHFMLENAM
ncbi:hypothetical protein TrRE_jg11638 [Triparma retinervis]|uniref:Peroxisomal membrane protein PEX16 n=1 Tax=Triparma retinervis TaxID=2557542 RepID=A0A9W7G741_9STRA|nr:hypothetical protein TrRE_jg11638 [Triparma retinervis]